MAILSNDNVKPLSLKKAVECLTDARVVIDDQDPPIGPEAPFGKGGQGRSARLRITADSLVKGDARRRTGCSQVNSSAGFGSIFFLDGDNARA